MAATTKVIDGLIKKLKRPELIRMKLKKSGTTKRIRSQFDIVSSWQSYIGALCKDIVSLFEIFVKCIPADIIKRDNNIMK